MMVKNFRQWRGEPVSPRLTGDGPFLKLWQRFIDIRSISASKGEFFLITLAATLLEGCGGGGGGNGLTPQIVQAKIFRLELGEESGGPGDDTIVVLGKNYPVGVVYWQYTQEDLYYADIGLQIEMEEVNNNEEDDADGVDEINGGDGYDTIIVYGESDLSTVELISIERLLLNSDVTVNGEQLGDGLITTIIGDDGTVLRLRGNKEVRLSELDLENIPVIDVGAGITLIAASNEELTDADGANINKLLGKGEVRVESAEMNALAGIQLDAELTVYIEDATGNSEGGLVGEGHTFNGMRLIQPVTMETEQTLMTLDENTDSAGIEVANIKVDGADATDQHGLILGGEGARFFELKGSKLHLKEGVTFDFENKKELKVTVYSVLIEYSDGNGQIINSDKQSQIVIRINDVNEAPSVATQSFSIAEDAVIGMTVGTVAATDPDTNSITLYSIIGGNDHGLFSIGAESGEITVAAGLDHESASTHILTVMVEDGDDAGLTANAPISITILNVNEAPSMAAQSFVITEDAAVGAAVGTVSVTDPDINDFMTYRITGGNDDGLFSIGVNNGVITVAAELDYELTSTHSLAVTVTDRNDGHGLSATAPITIMVTDVDDPPVTSGDLEFAVGAGRNYHLTVADVSVVTASDHPIPWEVTSGASNGYLALSLDTAASITSFTQTQLEAGEVVYIHSGRGTADSFAVSASGGDSVTVNVEVVQDTFPATPSYSVSNPWLAALLHESVWETSPSDASVAVIEYAFHSGATTDDTSGLPLTAPAWEEHEKNAVRHAMAAWEAVCNIDFVEVAGGEAPEIEYWKYSEADIGVGTLAYHYAPADGVPEPLLGIFGYEATGWSESGLMEGGIGFETIVHELGHALGLAHPHGDGGETFPGVDDGEAFGVYGDYSLNQGIYTVMSYNSGWHERYPIYYIHGPDSHGQVATPMALDITAIQILYGANTETAIGDNIYLLPDANTAGTFWSCIWDSAGDDTISAAGSDIECRIDLRAADLAGAGGGGYISHHAGTIGGFTIANTVVIENAIGGSYNDMIIGNAAGNTFTGGSGADIFVFHDNFGSDTITDFDVSGDIIRFVGFAEVTSRTEFVTASVQDGADVVYDFANDGINVLRLEGVSLSALQPASADDNFQLGYVTSSFMVSATAVSEGGTAAQVSVTLNAPPGREVAIPITITPRGGAAANDYSISGLTGGMLVFAAAASGAGLTQTFSIQAVDDAVVDTDSNIDERLLLQVGILPAAATEIGIEATVRLLDNDKTADFTVSVDGVWSENNIGSAQEADGIRVSTISGARYRVTVIAEDDLSAYVRAGGAWAQGTDWASLVFAASGSEEVITFSDYQTLSLGDDESDHGNYRIKVERIFTENADAAASSLTTATMTTGSVFQGELTNGDARDWVSVAVGKGYYAISLVRNGEVPLRDPFLRLYDTAGNPVADNDDILDTEITESHLVFRAPTAGTYYVEVTSYSAENLIFPVGTGGYTLTFSAALPEISEIEDATATIATEYEIKEDEVFIGELSSASDRDWIELSSVSGINYIFSAAGEDSSGDALNLMVGLYNSLGEIIRRSDSHGDDNGILIFNDASYGEGTYYIEVSLANSAATGGKYTLVATAVDNEESWTSYLTDTDRLEKEKEEDEHGHFHRIESDFDAYTEAFGSEDVLLG